MKKHLKILLIVFAVIALLTTIAVFGINAFVKITSENSIVSAEEAQNFEDADCILVLGCSVKNNKTPSDMLEDRINNNGFLSEMLDMDNYIKIKNGSGNDTWFGQLMAKPQLMAWLVQMDYFFEKYNVKIV